METQYAWIDSYNWTYDHSNGIQYFVSNILLGGSMERKKSRSERCAIASKKSPWRKSYTKIPSPYLDRFFKGNSTINTNTIK